MMEERNWPELKKYEECWPVCSILKLVLKYGAESTRRANAREGSRRLQRVLKGMSSEADE